MLYGQELCVEPFGLLKKLIWFLKVFNNYLQAFVVSASGMCSSVVIVVKTCHTIEIGMEISLVTADPNFFESQEKKISKHMQGAAVHRKKKWDIPD